MSPKQATEQDQEPQAKNTSHKPTSTPPGLAIRLDTYAIVNSAGVDTSEVDQFVAGVA